MKMWYVDICGSNRQRGILFHRPVSIIEEKFNGFAEFDTNGTPADPGRELAITGTPERASLRSEDDLDFAFDRNNAKCFAGDSEEDFAADHDITRVDVSQVALNKEEGTGTNACVDSEETGGRHPEHQFGDRQPNLTIDIGSGKAVPTLQNIPDVGIDKEKWLQCTRSPEENSGSDFVT